MGWIKKPRRSPRHLGVEHLDTVLVPDDYQQPRSFQAQKALGYPWEGVAGRYELREWFDGNLIGIYVSWNGGIAKRTYYEGAWTPWVDATGKVVE